MTQLTDPQDADAIGYPPAPWHLEGQMTLMLWNVPTALVADRVPRAARPVSVAGRSVLGTAWVRYGPGGVLSYGELLAAVHVWDGWRIHQTVTDIWVDEPVSVAGGRALWAIPKDLAAFGLLDGRSFACGPAQPGAEDDVQATFRPGRRLPGRPWASWTLLQERPDGTEVRSRTRLQAKVTLGHGSMAVRADGRLGFLSGRRPFAAVQLDDMAVTFGV